MILFGKEIHIKDYDCSFNKNCFAKRPTVINLYIQAHSICNASCDFCNIESINKDFDYKKLETIISELQTIGILGRVSITGGEPLLMIDKVNKILEISHQFTSNIVINTNGYNLEYIKEIYDKVNRIYISKHHYDNNLNDEIMGIKTPTIPLLSSIDISKKISLHCVLQKGYIDNQQKMEEYMDAMGETSIRKVKFISLYALNDKAVAKMIDINTLMDSFKNNTNSGILYDKHYCSCLDFVYVTKTGKVINALLRNNKTNHFDCCRQLVYDGKYLYDGFEKKQIIL